MTIARFQTTRKGRCAIPFPDSIGESPGAISMEVVLAAEKQLIEGDSNAHVRTPGRSFTL